MVSGSRRVGRLKARTKVQSDARAAIATGRVSLEQAAPVREFDGDASARPR